MQLRPYQQECVEAISRHYRDGVNLQAISGPCGFGKTAIMASLPNELNLLPGESVFFIAHRHELIDQAAAKFRMYNPDLVVDIERENQRAAHDADIVVASV